MIVSLSYVLHKYSKKYNSNYRGDNGKIENKPQVMIKFAEQSKGYKRAYQITGKTLSGIFC
jgi:hypothetical protein